LYLKPLVREENQGKVGRTWIVNWTGAYHHYGFGGIVQVRNEGGVRTRGKIPGKEGCLARTNTTRRALEKRTKSMK